MTPNNNLSVLPWYTSPGQQNARKWWVYNRIYPLFTPAGYSLPFQLIVPHQQSTSVSLVELYDGNTNQRLGGYTSAFLSGGLSIKQFDDYDVVVFPGSGAIFGSMTNGRYYLKMTVNGVDYYSEVFTVVNDIEPYLEIEWWDIEDFVMDDGTIVYTEPEFKNRIFLQADIAKPEYLFEEEGENRDGYFFPIKQISEKRYRFNFLASEYLLDVMRFIRMADYVKIIKNGQTYNVDSFLLTPEWEAEGDVASVNVEFDTNTIAKKIPFIDGGVIPPSPEEHYLTANPSSIVFYPAGRTTAISIFSDTSWSLTLPSWITADIMSGSGNGTVELTAQANTGQTPREGIVKLSGSGARDFNIAVSQPVQGVSYLSVSPLSIDFLPAGQTVNVSVSADVYWELSVPSWITASQVSGSTDAIIALTAAPNNTGAARPAANAVFSAPGSTGVPSVNVAVSQASPAGAYLNVTPSGTIDVGAQAGTITLNISSNVSWSILMLTTSPWLSTTDPTSGNGNATITFAIAQNAGVERTAQLEISTSGVSPTIYRNVNIRQAATSVTYTVEFEPGDQSFTFGADGDEMFYPGVYGVTRVGGSETSRVILRAADLTFSRSGDAITTRDGLNFSASNLGTTVTSETHEVWTLTWNAHPTASATLNLYQLANTRTVNSRTQSGSFTNVPATLVWDGSGTNEANANGDTMTINPMLHYTLTEDVSYSSGIRRNETQELNLAGAVTVSSTGLSVSGSGTNWVVTYAQNTGNARSGSITVRQSESNPFTPTYYYSETRSVSQAARGVASQLKFEATDPETYHEGTHYTSNRGVHNDYIMWQSPTFDWTIFTSTNPQIGDLVYLNAGLTQSCGSILDVYY